MKVQDMLKERNISIYSFAKFCNLHYSAAYNIAIGKTDLRDCKVRTVEKIAEFFGVTIDSLLEKREETFDHFRDELHHELKRKGDYEFIIDTLQSNEIRILWEEEKPAQSLYLLSMVDYLCRRNDVPIAKEYKDIRGKKLEEQINLKKDNYHRSDSKKPIKEFLIHNIVEGDIDDAV